MSNMAVQTNVMAINSHRSLGLVGNSQARASARLSSGFRINSAADDAAGLAISEKMRAQIRGLDQASRNGQDGISLIQTAEGAMNIVNDMVIRIRELVVQASNDTNAHDGENLAQSDRIQIQREINALMDEIDEITVRTEFNTRTLLDGSLAAPVAGEGVSGASGTGNFAPITTDQLANLMSSRSVGNPLTDVQLEALLSFVNENIGTDLEATVAERILVDNVGAGLYASDFLGLEVPGWSAVAERPRIPLTNEQVQELTYALRNNTDLTEAEVTGVVNGLNAAWFASGATTAEYNFDYDGNFRNLSTASLGEIMGAPATLTVAHQAAAMHQLLTAAVVNNGLASGPITGEIGADLARLLVDEIRHTGADGTAQQRAMVRHMTDAQWTLLEDSLATRTRQNLANAIGAAEWATNADVADGTNGLGTAAFVAVVVDQDPQINYHLATVNAVLTPIVEQIWIDNAAIPAQTAAPFIGAPQGAGAAQTTPAFANAGVFVDWFNANFGEEGLWVTDPTVDPDATSGLWFHIGANSLQGIQLNIESVNVTRLSQVGEGLTNLTVSEQTLEHVNDLGRSFYNLRNRELEHGLGVMLETGADINKFIDAIDAALAHVAGERANLGATQNRLEFTIENLDIASENLSAANSRIRDADMAQEMMRFTQSNVLQQAAISMLAQANQAPQSILQLLR